MSAANWAQFRGRGAVAGGSRGSQQDRGGARGGSPQHRGGSQDGGRGGFPQGGNGQGSGRGGFPPGGSGQGSGRGGFPYGDGGQRGGRGGTTHSPGISGDGGMRGGGTFHDSGYRGRQGGGNDYSGGQGGGFGRGGGSGGGRGGGGFGSGGNAPEGSALFSPVETLEPPSKKVAQLEDALLASSKDRSIASLTLSSKAQLPRRPGYGTRGMNIILRTNYFDIVPKPNLQLYRYHIAVLDSKGAELAQLARRKLKRAFELFIETAIFSDARPAIATDYRSILISLKSLNINKGESREETIAYRESEQQVTSTQTNIYKFRITFHGIVAVDQLMTYLESRESHETSGEEDPIKQALNIVMMRKPSSHPNVTSLVSNDDRNRFFPTGEQAWPLGGGLVALRGYYSSVRPAIGRLLLNVNSITSAFYQPGSLIGVVQEFRSRENSDFALSSFLKGVRVAISHLPKEDPKSERSKKVIFGLGRVGNSVTTALTYTFESNGRQTNVVDYFRKTYDIQLKYPREPLVNVGNIAHPIMMPIEQCHVLPGQSARRKLDVMQTEEMIKVAARTPGENGRFIVGEGASILGLKNEQTNGPSLFDLSVTPRMITVPGRILQPPSIEYAKGKRAVVIKGGWNMASLEFSRGAHVRNWSYFMIQSSRGENLERQETLQGLVDKLRNMIAKSGATIDVAKPSIGLCSLADYQNPRNCGGPQLEDYDRALNTWFAHYDKIGVKMLFIVLFRKDAVLYARLKYLAEVRWGIHTICSDLKKLSPRNKPQGDSYFANIALKFNLKTGGSNQQLAPNAMGILAAGKTMLVGIDVTHPSPGSIHGAPSIAAVVASVNKECSQWPGSLRAQESRQEMVQDLAEMMIERLHSFRRYNNKVLPQSIVVYRDGVSEGQYEKVLAEEAPAIDSAVQRIYPANGAKPKVSIFVVGKRHHTRFFPTQANDTHRDRFMNPIAGTVVDRGVTSKKYWDMFLQAHHGLQGTAKPAHYVVIKDENHFTADSFETLTHNLCYLQGRATKAVSVCPPAMYADKLCERGRCYLYQALSGSGSEAGSQGSAQAGFDWSSAPWTRDVHAGLRESMYYI